MQEAVARVFLVDSRAVSRVGLSVLLDREAGLAVVGDAADPASALPSLAKLSPDVVIVDGQDFEPCSSAEIRLLIAGGAEASPRVLAMVPHVEQVVDSWQAAGSWGVLDNRASPECIAAAVRMIRAGYRLVVPHRDSAELHTEEPDRATRAGVSDPPLEAIGITRRERDVLELVIRGYSNAEISEALFLSESTVKSHVQRMLGKLALRNRVHAVIYAYEKGIVRAGDNIR